MKKARKLKLFKITSGDWDRIRRLRKVSAEKRIEWLDGMRALMFEVWKNNPALRKQYEKLNH